MLVSGMDLFILRHGLAGTHLNQLARDQIRPLTSKGIKKMKEIAKAIEAMELEVDHIWSSPYKRSRQTAEIVAKVFKKKVELVEALGADESPKKFYESFSKIRPRKGSLMLVGHEPFLSSLMSLFICGEPSSQFELKKGGLCQLTITTFQPQPRARLDWLLTPKQMALMK
jgi:phosphohistidine phosphatase